MALWPGIILAWESMDVTDVLNPLQGLINLIVSWISPSLKSCYY